MKIAYQIGGALGAAFMIAATPYPDIAEHQLTPEQRYEYLLSTLPDAVATRAVVKRDLPYEIKQSYSYLYMKCGALQELDPEHKWTITEWLNDHVTADEWAASPYKFRISAFKAMAVQKNTDEKWKLLETLYQKISHDPDYNLWIEKSKMKIHKEIFSSTYHSLAVKNWSTIAENDEQARDYAAELVRLSLKTYFPHTETSIPSIVIDRSNKMDVAGSYNRSNNTIILNMADDNESTIKKNPLFFRVIVLHESFHFIQNILKTMYLNKDPALAAPLRDAGEKIYFGTYEDLAHAAYDKYPVAYENSFIERTARIASYAAYYPEVNATTDPSWQELYKKRQGEIQYPESGTIPAACFK